MHFRSKFLSGVSKRDALAAKIEKFLIGFVWKSLLFNNKRSLILQSPQCGRHRLPAHILKGLQPPISTDLDLGDDEPGKVSDNPVPRPSSIWRAEVRVHLIKRPDEYADRIITNYQ